MRIYFNRKPVSGPWGGGSKVLQAIVEETLRRGHEVSFDADLFFGKFDLLFCMDPRPSVTSFSDLIDYKRKNGTKLLQRIGDLGTHGKPEILKMLQQTHSYADVLVFPSKWAKEQLKPHDDIKTHVIHNAPLEKFFIEKQTKSYSGTIRVVSHHWSSNVMKGFDIYQKLDSFCDKESRKKFDFQYIGRKPDDVILKNYLSPQDVDGLVKTLPQNHVYVTASRHEAGANHVLEAMALGLPVLYHKDGGSINEYCQKSGLMYRDFDHLVELLENHADTMEKIATNMDYKRTSKHMAHEYVDLFEDMLR